MALVPASKEAKVFDNSIDGVFGSFKTSDSYELNYLQTTLRINDLQKIETASDAFDFQNISFEELIQRDIDYERVDDDLISKYLEKGKNRVLFFPPILVSLMAVADGKIIDSYTDIKTNIMPNELVRTWDADKFQLSLALSSEPTGFTTKYEGKTYNYYHYASTIKYNSERVKLVVIDGQHRFVALRELIHRGKSELIEGIQIPVCIFFTPDALEENGNIESIKKDLRELFVTINTTAKEVSGHFIVLLDDNSLASYTVRDLSDKWKEADDKLFLLEWNTREKKRSSQRQKRYSVTTVSILNDCLRDHLYSGGLTEIILNLPEVQKELEADESWPVYGDINEDTFHPGQINVIKRQIAKHVTPSLDVLFTQPRPYKLMKDKFDRALDSLDRMIESSTPGIRQFKNDYLFKFRKVRESDQDKVIDASRDFENQFSISDEDEIYFLNVFQQGLIRAWLSICEQLIRPFGQKPEILARSLVCALDKLCFLGSSDFFNNSNPHLQLTIYNGQRVLVNAPSKSQWKNLILSSFCNKKVLEEFLGSLKKESGLEDEKIYEVEEIIDVTAKKSLSCFVDYLNKKIHEDIEKNWKFKDYDKQILTYLVQRENSKDAKFEEEFDEKIKSLVDEKLEVVKLSLSNKLGIKLENL